MKRVLCIVFTILLFCQAFVCNVFAANETGSPKHIPRVVSVVFDDSGSMYEDTDRWAYTSYAMQAFAAMMGEDDVLYVTYLNAVGKSGQVKLSKSAKQSTIDGFEKTMFGGGTPNKLNDGASCLKKEYKNFGQNAKYYLVVLADGQLDPGEGDMASDLKSVTSSTESKLEGADFESIYFSMDNKAKLDIPGVTCHKANSSNQIVSVLRDISADIMGRTQIDHSVSKGKLSFELKYPALSVAIFVQSSKTKYSNVKVPIKKSGSDVSLKTGVYYVECPTTIVKNTSTTIYKEKKPSNPPSGFVTLIDNGNNSIAKGSYTIDFSKYNVTAKDLVVLVEPAVKIGCKYSIGDSTKTVDFDELKKIVRDEDAVTVECGLYEMNSDGSIGEAIPLDVLSPKYKVYINDEVVGKKLEGNRYRFTINKDKHENKELRIEASLEGYQPFVMRETFGEIGVKLPVVPSDPNANATDIEIIKPEFKDWIEGEKEIRFALEEADNDMLNEMLSISVSGYDGLPSGKCSTLGDSVRVDGNDIVYTPRFAADTDYSKLPETFKVSLVENSGNAELLSTTVTVKQPEYKFEINNELEGEALSLGMLKDNTKQIAFTLQACYDGSGKFAPVNGFDFEDDVTISLDKGILTGEVKEAKAAVSFIPKYDTDTNTEVSADKILSTDHEIYAVAKIGDKEIESDKIKFSVAGGSYKITVDNEITEAFTLDSIKTNDKKIVFALLADYNGDGNYGAVEDWDNKVYEKLSIDSGELPGKFETVYDAGGKAVGKAFIPNYDENNNNGVVFTAVAGKVHTIKATLEGQQISAETTVEVLPPKYELTVRKDGITLVDTKLIGNEEAVEFVVARDGRILSKAELEALAPYKASFSKTQKWVDVKVTVCEAEDGTSYLSCAPVYGGWKFISPKIWNLFSPLRIKSGDQQLNLTVGANTASADICITKDMGTVVILVIMGAVLLLILWIIFCYLTRIRFLKGHFYVLKFKKVSNTQGYTHVMTNSVNPSKGSFVKFLFGGKCLIPFSKQATNLSVYKKKAGFIASDSSETFFGRTYPDSKADNAKYYNRGHLRKPILGAILRRERGITIDSASLEGKKCGKQNVKMDVGTFLVENDSNGLTISLITFLSAKAEKTILNTKNTKKIKKK